MVHLFHMDGFSTRQAAKLLGLPLTTLARYIAKGKVPTPKTVSLGGMRVHLWTKADIERVRALLPKIANGRKTRYKRKHSALSNQHSVKAKPETRASSKPAQARAPVVPKSKQHKKK